MDTININDKMLRALQHDQHGAFRSALALEFIDDPIEPKGIEWERFADDWQPDLDGVATLAEADALLERHARDCRHAWREKHYN